MSIDERHEFIKMAIDSVTITTGTIEGVSIPPEDR